ncbi:MULTISPECIES: siderophore-interacting protein [unclassified Curtobacterium]|uniref:siderophore-interacting protein n=1 Tax=unclassified Curtobacterium TaxID=257496 RepID=UPI000DA8CC99|nr:MULTISPECIES: siderophore-interacting protein [unclassified Curtobacterium]PZE28888.1 siderophore-interacting protein [Curtobacterium sp. MCBD17_028]PZF57605.1 siderophore-interacting protein [Curtobacterium sp. MCBD17_034]PZM33697.1 siderophore-interacting protein [Curtobacterium sp. MCBD17_031]
MVSTRYRTFAVRVLRITPLTPHFVRVTLTGDELADFAAVGLDQRIKVVLPLPHGGYESVPGDDAGDWFTAWRALPDERRNPIRTYTVRSFRPAARELDIDFVDHGDIGPASRWVGGATVGDELRVVGPVVARGTRAEADTGRGAAEFAPGSAQRVMIAGDETAAPAICAILEALDAGTVGHVFIEVPTEADRLPVAAPRGVEVTWLPRNGADHGLHMTEQVRSWALAHRASRAAATAAPVLADVDVDNGILWEVPDDDRADDSVYAWIAGEAGCVKEIRRHLVRGAGMDRRSVAFMGYWRRGRAEC